MDSAYLVFSKKGYEKATIDDIAFAAGYTKGAFYWNFKSKEDLFLKIIEYRVTSQQSYFLNVLQRQGSKLNVQVIFQEMVELTRKDCWTPIFIEFLAHASRNESVKLRMAYMYRNWRKFLSAILEELKKSNCISLQINSETTAALFIALFDGFNMQNLVEDEAICLDTVVNALNKLLT